MAAATMDNIDLNKLVESYNNKKEYHREYMRTYRQTNKDAIANINRQSYTLHKEDRIAKQKSYYEANKEVIIDCQCGAKVRKTSMSMHLKTKKHLKAVSDEVN